MLIRVDDITESGLALKVHRGANWVTNIPDIVNGTTDMVLNRDVEIDCKITKILKNINIRGLMQFGIKTVCYKCLQDVELGLQAEINLILTPKDEFGEDQIDIGHDCYEGDSVDLSDYFREQIAMNLPCRVVCKEECEGLCSQCGVDLNFERCCCQKNFNNSTFMALKDIKV